MLRKIIQINEELCDGCGDCEIGCSEGAIKVINGKAKLVKEEYCDGFGDCLKECPKGAIKISLMEAKPFSEIETKENLLKTKGYEAVWKMEESMQRHQNMNNEPVIHQGCPGSLPQSIQNKTIATDVQENDSKLKNWPIQLTLLPLKAPYYQNADLLLAADCCAHSISNFHQKFLNGHTLAIACPKLDNISGYEQKLISILKENEIKSITVLYMEVPCCTGIVRIAENSLIRSEKNIPFKKIKIGINGNILEEN